MNMRISYVSSLVAVVLWCACSTFSQNTNTATSSHGSPAGASESAQITREQAEAILEELRQIRHLLESDVQSAGVPPESRRKQVRLENVPDQYVMGRSDAPVTLVEFMDYQCPFCRKFHNDVFSKLKTEYIDTGKLRFISLDFPLPIHSNALKAAEAVRCAGEQGRYWEMRDSLIAHSDNLGPDSLEKYAQNVGLDTVRFSSCIQIEKYKPEVEADREKGSSVSISGTPSFIVAKTAKGELDGTMTVGSLPFSALESQIDSLLESDKAAKVNTTASR